jgi:hypothetical protein
LKSSSTPNYEGNIVKRSTVERGRNVEQNDSEKKKIEGAFL